MSNPANFVLTDNPVEPAEGPAGVKAEPLPLAKKPPLGPRVVTGFYYGIGIAALIALVGFGLADSQSVLDIVSPDSFLVLFWLSLTGSLCNFLRFKVPPGLYLALSMVVFITAVIIFPPIPATIPAIVASVVFEIFVAKRGLAFAVRTCGIYILAGLTASLVYQLFGQRPYLGDLTWRIIVPSLAAFLTFRIINEVLIVASLLLEGNSLKESLSHIPMITGVYLIFLPGSIMIAMFYFQSEFIAFTFACLLVILGGFSINRAFHAREKETQQLSLVRELNEQLARQNERQRILGLRINQSLTGFLPLIQYYTQTSYDQESAVTQIAATIEELSRTANQIAGSANNVATAAEQARSAADSGQQALAATIDAIREVRRKMQEIADKISELEDRSERIGEIVTVINGIAGEIRLLALNATIEASGAGQFGRRFSVVANEVNQLADRSREALKQIKEIIAEIQGATVSSRRATVEGLNRMERSFELAALSEKANQEIISVVDHTAQTAAAISLATQQQRNASEQVVSSVRHVTSRISQNAERLNSVSVASVELETIATELQAQTAGQPGSQPQGQPGA
jgi:methyl-accepting chemotaxis protein